MTNNRVITNVESLVEMMSSYAELKIDLQRLRDELAERDRQIAELRNQLAQYWNLRDDVDYQGLIEQIREDAKTVTEKLKSLDRHAIRQFAGMGGANSPEQNTAPTAPDGLVSDVLALLRSIGRWK